MSELSRRLHKVDPDLTVISGAAHRRGATESEWLTSVGITCPGCLKETFRHRDGYCIPCWEQLHEFEIRDTCGALDLLPESVIMEIAHKSRGD